MRLAFGETSCILNRDTAGPLSLGKVCFGGWGFHTEQLLHSAVVPALSCLAILLRSVSEQLDIKQNCPPAGLSRDKISDLGLISAVPCPAEPTGPYNLVNWTNTEEQTCLLHDLRSWDTEQFYF